MQYNKKGDTMKKLLLFTLIILFIPFIIVTLLIKEEIKKDIKYKLNEKTNIKIKREDESIIEVPFEEYIVGVVAAEMPANFELEALKAQAVAARSYVIDKIEKNKDLDYDILDTKMNQVYIDDNQMREKWKNKYDEYLNKVKQAVNETKGEYLTYQNKVIQAFFFSTSNGKTENSKDVFSEDLPYLRSVDSSWDDISPVFNDTETFTKDEFCFNLGIECSKINIKILERNETGSVKTISVNDKVFKGTDFRTKLKIRSTYFDIKQENDKIIISTTGYGHGVGMSQYGAQALSLKGKKYDEILKYYYQGVEISKL